MTQLVTRPVMDSSGASQLVKMPLEVLQRIAYFLPTSDLCLLRLTCKAVESSVFIAFTREFFAKKQFMLTEFSLQTLLNISQHPTLGPSLTHLIIGLDQYYVDRPRTIHSHTIEDELELRDAFNAQQELLNTGRASNLLAQALRNLRGLQTVDIRDFNSPSRWRDGGAQWSSYGATIGGRYNHQLVIGPTHYSANKDVFVDRAFKIVLVALAESGIDLPNIEVVLKDRAWGLTSQVFDIRPWLAPTLRPILANLQRLHLAVLLSSERPASYITGTSQPQDPAMTDPFNAGLRSFLALTPNLLWLRVNFQSSGPEPTAKFLTWLGRLAPIDNTPTPFHDPAPISLPLQQLDLGVLNISPAILLAALVKFASTLKAVNLWDIALVSTQSDWDDKVNLWARLFKSLANSSLDLQSFMLGRVRQVDIAGYLSATVNFGTRANGTPVGSTRCSSSAKDFLLKLAKETSVVFPETPEYDSEGDEVDGDGDFDDQDVSDFDESD